MAVVGGSLIAYSQTLRGYRFPGTQIAMWASRKGPTNSSPRELTLFALGVGIVFGGAGAAQVDHGWWAMAVGAMVVAAAMIAPAVQHNRLAS